MFPSKRIPEQQGSKPTFVKDWRDAGPEIERLGQQLDAARQSADYSKEGSWAKNFWTTQSDVLFRKWTQSVRLQEVGMRQQVKPKLAVTYDWWEPSDEVPMRFPLLDGISNWLTEHASNPNLNRAWDMARDESLQRARQGLG